MIRALLLVPAAMCLLALLQMPYGYYQLLRLVVTLCAASFAVVGWRRQSPVEAVGFGLLALTYNPMFPLHLDRAAWEWVNIVTAAVFLLALAVCEWRLRNADNPGAQLLQGRTLQPLNRGRLLPRGATKLDPNGGPGRPVKAVWPLTLPWAANTRLAAAALIISLMAAGLASYAVTDRTPTSAIDNVEMPWEDAMPADPYAGVGTLIDDAPAEAIVGGSISSIDEHEAENDDDAEVGTEALED